MGVEAKEEQDGPNGEGPVGGRLTCESVSEEEREGRAHGRTGAGVDPGGRPEQARRRLP